MGGCGAAEGNSKPCKPFCPTQYIQLPPIVSLRCSVPRKDHDPEDQPQPDGHRRRRRPVAHRAQIHDERERRRVQG